MEKLFYSKKDSTLYWIAGYTKDGNMSSVVDMTNDLLQNAKVFSEVAGCEVGDVQTHYNQLPPQYQYMRVFYVKTEKIPAGTTVIERGMFDHLAGR